MIEDKARTALALESLLSRIGERVDGRRRAALSNLLHGPQDPDQAPVHWALRLNLLLSSLGYVSSIVTYSPAQWRTMLHEDLPLLTCIPSDDGAPAWLVLSPGKQGARVTLIHDRARDYTVHHVQELVALLEVEADTPLMWLRAEAALPLEAMRLPPDDPREKTAKTLARLRALVGLERSTIVSIIVFSIFVGLFTLLIPLAVQTIVNTLSFGMLLQPIILLTLLILLGLAFAGVLRVFQFIVVEYLQRRLFARVVMDTTNRLVRMDTSVNDTRYIPEVVNRFFDVMTVQKAASSLLLDGIGLVLQLVIGLIVLAFYHPLLLAFDIVLILALGVILLLGRGAIKTGIYESNAKYAVASWLEDLASAQNLFKSGRNMELAVWRAEKLTRNYLDMRDAHYRIVLRQILGVAVLQALSSAAVLGLGGYLVLQGQLTLGQLVAAELIVTLIVDSIVKFGKHFETFYKMNAGIYKLGELVDLPQEPTLGQAPLTCVETGMRVELKDVSFGYKDRPILDKATFEIAPGKRVALTRSRAQGKSSVLELLYGLRAPQRGVISLDGVELPNLVLPALREQVTLIHEPEFIAGTLEDNMRVGQWSSSRDDLIKLMHRVGLGACLEGLPAGVDTVMTSSGAPLSRSQLILMALARAIAHRPRLLLLDGLLDELDDDTIERVWGALTELGATVLIVTHKAEIMDRCDAAFTLQGGRFQEVTR